MPSSLTQPLAQFSQQYPGGSLTAEFVTIHDNTYVVRAIAQTGSLVLTTAMAAAATIEAAEDQAKLRALACLGIGSASPAEPPTRDRLTSIDSIDAPPLELVPQAPADPAPPALVEAVSPAPSPSPEPVPEPEAPTPAPNQFDLPPLEATIPGLDGEVPLSASSATQPSPSVPSTRQRPQAKPAKAKAPKASAQPPTGTLAPKDLSDIIVKTSVELKRLGWQEEEGRQHLQSVYGKRSRQHLTDQELVDFLQYLEQQPTPTA